MVNAFLKYGLIIAVLIIFLKKVTSLSCNYSEAQLRLDYSQVIHHQIAFVKQTLNNFTNFTNCCRGFSFENVSELFPEMCSTSAMENKANKTKEFCYNFTSNLQRPCQIKNLVHIGCLLQQSLKNLKSNSTEGMSELKGRLEGLVNSNKSVLCVNIARKKRQKRQKRTKNPKEERSSKKRCHNVCKIKELLYGLSHHWQQFMGTSMSA